MYIEFIQNMIIIIYSCNRKSMDEQPRSSQ